VRVNMLVRCLRGNVIHIGISIVFIPMNISLAKIKDEIKPLFFLVERNFRPNFLLPVSRAE